MGRLFGKNPAQNPGRTGKKRVVLALAALLAVPGTASAFYLGNIKVLSNLGEPFKAEIPFGLRGDEETKGIHTTIGGVSEYAFLDLHRTAAVSGLKTEVVRNETGNRILISGQSPVDKPFFNLLLKTSLGRGSHFRNYPVFIELSKKDKVLATPGAVPGLPPPRFLPASPIPAPPASRPLLEGKRYGPIVQGETLASIAAKLKRADGRTLSQWMVAIWKYNRDRFLQGNINGLPVGMTLDIPNDLSGYAVERAEALATLKRQWRMWRGLIPSDYTPPARTIDPVSGPEARGPLVGRADPLADAPLAIEGTLPEPPVIDEPAMAVEEIVRPLIPASAKEPAAPGEKSVPVEKKAVATRKKQPSAGTAEESYDLRLTVAPQGADGAGEAGSSAVEPERTAEAPVIPAESRIIQKEDLDPGLVLKLDQSFKQIEALTAKLAEVSAQLSEKKEAPAQLESQLSVMQKRISAMEADLRKARQNIVHQRKEADTDDGWMLYAAAAALVVLLAGLLALYNRRKTMAQRLESELAMAAASSAAGVTAVAAVAAADEGGAEEPPPPAGEPEAAVPSWSPETGEGGEGAGADEVESIPRWNPPSGDLVVASDETGDESIPLWTPENDLEIGDGVEIPDLGDGGVEETALAVDDAGAAVASDSSDTSVRIPDLTDSVMEPSGVEDISLPSGQETLFEDGTGVEEMDASALDALGVEEDGVDGLFLSGEGDDDEAVAETVLADDDDTGLDPLPAPGTEAAPAAAVTGVTKAPASADEALESLEFALPDETPDAVAETVLADDGEEIESVEFAPPDEPIGEPEPAAPLVDEPLESVEFSPVTPPAEKKAVVAESVLETAAGSGEEDSDAEMEEIPDDLLDEIGVVDAEETLPLGSTLATMALDVDDREIATEEGDDDGIGVIDAEEPQPLGSTLAALQMDGDEDGDIDGIVTDADDTGDEAPDETLPLGSTLALGKNGKDLTVDTSPGSSLLDDPEEEEEDILELDDTFQLDERDEPEEKPKKSKGGKKSGGKKAGKDADDEDDFAFDLDLDLVLDENDGEKK